MEAIDIIASRRSVRDFTDEVPAKELIEKIVAVAQSAPNAGPFHTTVLPAGPLMDEMDEANWQKMMGEEGFGKMRVSQPGYRPYYHAPYCIIFSGPQDGGLSAVNCACACTAGAYAASALGLASCFIMQPLVSATLIPDLTERLQLPEGYAPECGLVVGYANDTERFAFPSKQEPATWLE